MRVIAALGIGGTNFHYAAGTAAGELLTPIRTEPTAPETLTDQVLNAVADLQNWTDRHLDVVCATCKGLVDREGGAITYMDILDGGARRGVDLRGPVRDRFDLPLHLENDGAGAVLAEYHFGAGEEYATVVHATMGTGIGAGVVDRGRLLRGETNFAGEVGAIRVGPADGRESFGVPGAWEAYCSGPGIRQFVRQRLTEEDRETLLGAREPLSTQDVFDAAKAGDAVAEEYLGTVARYNALGVATVCNLYNPGLMTLGGGVALNNPEYVLEGIEASIDDYLVVDRPDLRVTELGEHIGIYGALAQLEHRP